MRALNARGKSATIDVLGEEIANEAEAARDRARLREVLAEIERARARLERQRQADRARARARPRALPREPRGASCAKRASAATSSASTWRTDHDRRDAADLPRAARPATTTSAWSSRPTCGGPSRDIDALADSGRTCALCKGIYVEPPDIACQGYDTVRANFVQALEKLIDARRLRRRSPPTTSS